MNELIPLTVSKSTRNAPTVLLTQSMEKYVLYAPVDKALLACHALFELIHNHFKLSRAKTGFFTLKGKQFFCVEQLPGTVELDIWHGFLWRNKRSFNYFLNPRKLFEMMLFDFYFPLWGGPSKKLILPHRKNQFAISTVPANNFEAIEFKPLSFSQLGMNHANYNHFFEYFKGDLESILEEFLILYHEKFMSDVKYTLSLYPELRNVYWNEVKKCFDASFIQFTTANIKNYIYHI